MEMLNSWWGGGKTEENTPEESGKSVDDDVANKSDGAAAADEEKVKEGTPSGSETETTEEPETPSVKPEVQITAEAALSSAKEWGSKFEKRRYCTHKNTLIIEINHQFISFISIIVIIMF